MERGRIDGIQPFAQLAEGSTTTVYKGYQERLDRFVLLKVLRPALARDEELAQRFEEEARLVAQIQHPNVVTIHDYGRTDDRRAYLATEFVEGTDLRSLLKEASLPPVLAAFVLCEAAKGLQAAHDRGILHRDLKPANVLLAASGQVKITDFGMASVAGDSVRGGEDRDGCELRGTPAYLAPEYVSGAAPSAAGDLFALGAILHEMLAAHRAFTGGSTGEVLGAVRHHDPLPVLDRFARPPERLRAIAEKLLAKDPAARYEDVGALLDDVHAFLRAQKTSPSASDLAAFLEDPAGYRDDDETRAPVSDSAGDDSATLGTEKVAEEDTPPSPFLSMTWTRVAVFGAALALSGIALWSAMGGDNRETRPLTERDVPAATDERPSHRSLPAESTAAGEQRDTLSRQAGKADSSAVPGEPASPNRTETPAPDAREQAAAGAESEDAETGGAEAAAPQRASLELRVSPWAEVLLDGESKGETPLSAPLTMAPGEHELVFKNDHFPRDVHRTVQVGPGEKRALKVRLFEHVGQLSVKVEPYAEVYIDGTSHGVRDMSSQQETIIVAPGEHKLELKNPQFPTHATRFTIEEGGSRSLVFNLRDLQ